MAKSIIQDTKECFITKSTLNLHKHHIMNGFNRKNSEKYGLWVWLRADWHNMSSYGVHFNRELDLKLKRIAQEKFEEIYGHEEWMRIFKRNYL